MNEFIIGVILVVIAAVAVFLWKSKKAKPTDPNFVDPGPVEDNLDPRDKR